MRHAPIRESKIFKEDSMSKPGSRVLTTHVGSLPRPEKLVDSSGVASPALPEAVATVVKRQVAIGLDIVNDGEFGKPGFASYAFSRLSGFDIKTDSPSAPWWAGSKEERDFPKYYAALAAHSPNYSFDAARMVCTGPITYTGRDALQRDLANFRSALDQAPTRRSFVPSCAPSNLLESSSNEYYSTEKEFLFAIAEAMREEYREILDAGHDLQVDDPCLVTHYAMSEDVDVADARSWALVRIEALNHALRGLPHDRIRLHTCYSIDIGPRTNDMELRDIVDVLLKANVGAYSFEAANPRHEHEWKVWKDIDLPDDKLIIPGVITQSSPVIEHPEAVADRIRRFVSIFGPERVIAGADCGFAAIADSEDAQEEIAWAKLASLVEGTRLANDAL
jgi:5-methyltetrahydropteroyltriglutamate--homocysteine methyltransferase